MIWKLHLDFAWKWVKHFGHSGTPCKTIRRQMAWNTPKQGSWRGHSSVLPVVKRAHRDTGRCQHQPITHLNAPSWSSAFTESSHFQVKDKLWLQTWRGLAEETERQNWIGHCPRAWEEEEDVRKLKMGSGTLDNSEDCPHVIYRD